MNEIKRLFPVESEKVLQVSARMNDLCGAVVENYLEKGDTQSARQWLQMKNIHNPDLLMRIDFAEISLKNQNFQLQQLQFQQQEQLQEQSLPSAPVLEDESDFIPTWGTVTTFSPFNDSSQKGNRLIELGEMKSNPKSEKQLIVFDDENVPSINNPPVTIKPSQNDPIQLEISNSNNINNSDVSESSPIENVSSQPKSEKNYVWTDHDSLILPDIPKYTSKAVYNHDPSPNNKKNEKTAVLN